MSTHWIVPDAEGAGWEHGLPPSISAAEWPRHASSGLPLVHGFTVRMPEGFRVRGPERVAMSYFHPGDTESYPPPAAHAARVEAILAGATLSAEEDAQPFFRALAEHGRAPKERTQLFTDLLKHTHAIVWLTEAELAAPRCERPAEAAPAGIEAKAMQLDVPVRPERPLGYVADEPKRPFIQFGGPLHWIQSEIEEFGEVVMEIEDGVGYANYGTGNCQIDLANGLLDWAC